MTGADALALGVGLAGAIALLVWPLPALAPHVAAGLSIGIMLAWIAWQDATSFTIPDGPLLAVALLGTAFRLSGAPDVAAEGLMLALDIGLCGGALSAIREAFYRLKGFDGLGFGDVKLAAACGALIGTVAFAHALLTASALGIAVVLAGTRLRPGRPIDRIPFGAFLAPVCAIAWILSSLPLPFG